jgi:2-(1,2-epoxy-1,2-dihydrophenyl)acetyl-CoA isomerase
MPYETLLVEKDADGVVTLTLNRPDRLNAASHTMVAEVPAAINAIAADPEARAVIITGAGRGFSAGQDLKGTPQDVPSLKKRYMPLTGDDTFVAAIRRAPQPFIAAVNGPAVGWGLSLAAACEMRIASEKATFAALWVPRGLPQVIPRARVFEFVLLGKTWDAREAEKSGLVNEVVPHEHLLARTREVALALAKGPPIALAMAKRAIYFSLRQDFESFSQYESLTLRHAFQSKDRLEGIRSFIEKRPPRFTGE